MKSLHDLGDDYCYPNASDYLLKHGENYKSKVMPDDLRQYLESISANWWRVIKESHCYSNCMTIILMCDAVKDSIKIEYCEGYAYMKDYIPVQHAWLVVEDKYVMDVTWFNHQTAINGVRHKFVLGDFEERCYFGVTIPTKVVYEKSNHQYVNVLYDYKNREPICKIPRNDLLNDNYDINLFKNRTNA